MSRRKPRVLGMRAQRDYRIPLCSLHRTPCVRNDVNEWMCPICADDWLKEQLAAKLKTKSAGGVELPAGSEDSRVKTASFRDIWPNRAFRRGNRG